MVLAPKSVDPIRSKYWDANTAVITASRGSLPFQGPEPVFDDDEWNCLGLVNRSNIERSSAILKFADLFPDPYRRLTAKELAMQRLNRPVQPCKRDGSRSPQQDVTTVKSVLYDLAALFSFMDEIGVLALQDLTQEHLNHYLRTLQDKRLSPKRLSAQLRVTAWLYEARDWLTYDCITFVPWGTKPFVRVVNFKPPAENLTPRIPEATMGPLLRWALLYVEDFAPDILSAHQEAEKLLEQRQVEARQPCASSAECRLRLEELIDARRREHRGLPGRSKPLQRDEPHYTKIASLIGVRSYHLLQPHKGMIDRAVIELGIEHPALSTEISHIAGTNKPWRGKILPGLDLENECRRLTVACYIVCAYLSGMRDSEVQDLRVGCHQVSRDSYGEVIRHYLRSTEHKGKKGQGIERTWVVVEPVARAIDVLERLTRTSRESLATDLLFLRSRGGSDGNPTIKRRINNHIATFIEHINSVLQPHLASPEFSPISIDGTGKVTTRMFRRTIAWHIANRPFGVVAGMIQYGHACDRIFEGYAGTSESGFRQEVEAERALARKADILMMYEDAKRGVRPAGPMASKLDAEFKAIRETLNDLPGKVFTDHRRREKMLEHLRLRLYPGLLADCFFDRSKAACLKHLDETARKEPINGICDPQCPNACWAKKHLPIWEHALADTQRLAKRNRISEIQRNILKARQHEYRKVIHQIREASHGRQEG